MIKNKNIIYFGILLLLGIASSFNNVFALTYHTDTSGIGIPYSFYYVGDFGSPCSATTNFNRTAVKFTYQGDTNTTISSLSANMFTSFLNGATSTNLSARLEVWPVTGGDPDSGSIIGYSEYEPVATSITSTTTAVNTTWNNWTWNSTLANNTNYWLIMRINYSTCGATYAYAIMEDASGSSGINDTVYRWLGWIPGWNSVNSYGNTPYFTYTTITPPLTDAIIPISPSTTATTTYSNFPVRFQATYTYYDTDNYDGITLRIGSTATSTQAYTLYYNIPAPATNNSTSTFIYDLNGIRNGPYIVTWKFHTKDNGSVYMAGPYPFNVSIPDNTGLSSTTPTASINTPYFQSVETSSIPFLATNACNWDGLLSNAVFSNIVCYVKNFIYDQANAIVDTFNTGMSQIISGSANVFPISTFVAINNDIQIAQNSTSTHDIILTGSGSAGKGILGGSNMSYTILTSSSTSWIQNIAGFDYKTFFDYVFYLIAGMYIFSIGIIIVKLFGNSQNNNIQQ